MKKNFLKYLLAHFGYFPYKNTNEDTFRKIGNYLNRLEYKFQSKHTSSGILYWVKWKV